MAGTLLLEDYEQANQDELTQHLQGLLTSPTPSDSLTNPIIQAAPAPAPIPMIAAPTPSDALTNPVIQQARPQEVSQAEPPEPTPEPSQMRDELQAHVDSLLAPPTPTTPPDAVSSPSEPPRPLQLLGEGLTSLNAGAQNVRQELQNHLTSLLAPPTSAPDVPPTPSDSLTNPVGTGNAAPPDRSIGLQDYARTAAQRAGIDPDIFVRQIQQESGFNPSAKSPAGAIGVAQFMPNTAQGMGIDPSDPYAALDAAAQMDAQHLKQYGGDWSKTLAAYNAGPGAVEKFGGVPPFQETQTYVKNILGGAKAAVAGAVQGAQQKLSDLSQFGDSQLTVAEANAACGPAAAVRFAQRFGRNPTLREATDLAATVGWTSGQGMAGLGSEKALMDKMGVATKLVSGADWGTFANEARTGNPVTISTQGHYFTADNWDPATNKFHVGRSGMDLRGGSEWMTPEQMTGLMGSVQGGLLADNPTTPASTASTSAPATSQGFTAPGASTDQQVASVDQPRPLQLIGEGFSALGSGAQNVASGAQQAGQGGLKIIDNAIDTATQAAGRVVADTSGPQTAAMQPTPSDTLTNPLGTRNAPEQLSAQLTGQPAAGIADATGPAVLPSIGEAKDALLQGDTQGALDALNRAGTAISTSAPAQAIAENQANPPLAGAREAIANAPVLGGALGMARGPELLTQEELLRTPEADTVRAIFDQSNARATAKGYAPTPMTDADIAEAARGLLLSQAVAMTGEGFGRPGEPGRSLSRPGAEEPATGSTQILGPRGEVLSTVPAASETTGFRAPEMPTATAAPEAFAGARAAPGETVTATTPTARVTARVGEAPSPPLPPTAETAGAPPPPPQGSVLDRTLQMFRDNDAKPPVRDRVGEWLGSVRAGAARNVADRNAVINEMTGRARAALGPNFTPDMDAETLVATYAGRGGAARQRVADSITPATKLVGDDLAELNAYRKFQRDAEVANLKGQGTRQASAGVTSAADAERGIQEIADKLGPERFARLQQADEQITQGLQRLLQDKVDAGLIAPDLAEQLMRDHPHYNPTVVMQHLAEGQLGVGGGSNRLTVNSNLLKRLAAEGSLDNTEQPIRSAVRQMVQGEVLIERNRAAQAIVKAAQADPTLEGMVKRMPTTRITEGPLISPTPAEAGQATGSVIGRMFGDVPGTISVYENGKRVLYSVPEPIERAVKSLDADTMGFVGKVLQGVNAPLRAGATALSAPFLVSNMAADAVTTYLREGARTASQIPKGWWAAASQNELYRAYQRAGGGMESLYQRTPQDLDKLIQQSGGQVARTPGDLANLVNPIRLLQRTGEVIEQAPRLATFAEHLRKGETPAEAALAGRRVTVDFARGGEAVKQANALMLFLNARVQGSLNVGRTLRDNPQSRARLAGLAGAVTGLYAYNRQFPEYADVPDYVKDQAAVIMLPGSVKDPEGPGYKKLNYIAIPLREWSAFTAPFTYALTKLDEGQNHSDRPWQDFAKSQVRTLSPMSGEDVGSMSSSILPAPLRTPIELGANTRFYSGLPVVSRNLEGLPPSQQYNERTSLFSRTLGDKLGVSPQQLDFIVQENLGGAGRNLLGMADFALRNAPDVGGWREQVQPAEPMPTAIPDEAPPGVRGLLGGVWKEQGGQLSEQQYQRRGETIDQVQEGVRRSIQSLPEYQTATPDRQRQMLIIAQSQVAATAGKGAGIAPNLRDLGLPNKFIGVRDPKKEQQITDALASYRAWEADPRNAPKPTKDELKLALAYDDPDLINPKWTLANEALQERNRAIRKSATGQTESAATAAR